MRRIGEEVAARRFARAIGRDIMRYNGEKLRAGQPIDAELAEGRELFRGRVEPHLFPLYEAEIEDVLGPRLAQRRDQRRPPETEPGRSPWPGRVLLITLVLFVFAAVALAFLRRR